ncbi:hypothetical protein EMIT0194MI4_10235 [Pseudomonas sp. IT-194MI4]
MGDEDDAWLDHADDGRRRMFAPEKAQARNGRSVVTWFRDLLANDPHERFLWRQVLSSSVVFDRHVRLVPLR